MTALPAVCLPVHETRHRDCEPKGRRRQDHDRRQSRRVARGDAPRVLLIDIDPQGNATMGCGIDKREVEFASCDVLLGDVPAADTHRRRVEPAVTRFCPAMTT